MLRKVNLLTIFILSITCIFFGILLIYNFKMHDYQQFSYLAESFLEGKLYFTKQYGSWWHDAVEFQNKYYWPLGPLPAVLLMPFVWLWQKNSLFFYQGYLQFALVLCVFILIFKLAKKIGYTITDSLFLSFAFSFASVFLGVAFWPNSWFFAQVVTVLLIFLSFWEFLTYKRYWVIGILFGMLLLTRFPAAIGVVFYGLHILLEKGRLKIKAIHLIELMLPFLICGLLLGWYNYTRFGNFLEQGYAMQITAGAFSESMKRHLFSLSHVPGNLYYLFFATPTPVVGSNGHILTSPFLKADAWGMGIFFTSPYFLYLFSLKYKNLQKYLLLGTAILIALPIVTYYGIGWYQFGYRYSLDFLPFLFLLFMKGIIENHSKLPNVIKIIIVCSALFNFYLFKGLFIL